MDSSNGVRPSTRMLSGTVKRRRVFKLEHVSKPNSGSAADINTPSQEALIDKETVPVAPARFIQKHYLLTTPGCSSILYLLPIQEPVLNILHLEVKKYVLPT
jgi:hypothetical protein